MAINTTVEHKRGVTFEQIVTIPADFADAYFVAWTPSAQIRSKADALISSAVCAWVNPTTTRELRLTVLDTTAWPIEALEFDVAFRRNSDGFVMKTETARLAVSKDITRL